MKRIVDIPDGEYEMYKLVANRGMGSEAIRRILKGTPLPEGAKILTKEAYSDLCLRASHERKTGRWIKGDLWSEGCGMGETYGYYYKCSECGAEVNGDYKECEYNFCPKCGAKMERAKKNDERKSNRSFER